MMAAKLQGGKFDHPSRLFFSIRHSWRSAAGIGTSTQDVRELIPEFFYLPEMFINKNDMILDSPG